MRPLVSAVLVLFLALTAACRGDRNTQAQQSASVPGASDAASGTYVLGSSVRSDGAVPEEAAGETFARGGPVFLSISVSGASRDQQIAVDWVDPLGRVVRHEERVVAKSAEYAPFSAGPTTSWRPGSYRVSVVIDGRRVTEQPFTVA